MFPGDVAVGWVLDNGTVHFSDRHTVGHSMPVMDKSQDWHLLSGEENDFGTVLKFVRKINTCDDAEDKIISETTTRLIFAYGNHDPADEHSITYHGTTRGTKSVSLLIPNTAKDNLPTNVKHYDFLNNNFLVPSATTTYFCRGFKMPMIGKHHMIKPFYFPNDLGFSVGGPDDEFFYIMETHIDNPTRKSDMIDNSGIRITITQSLRKHEAGMLQLGHLVGYSQIIPPGQKQLLSKGYCSEECVREGFRQSNLTEIKIIGSVQHSHLLGVGMTTRHFRNGSELKPLVDDPNYDFNFQAIRVLPKEVSVYPGDSFRTDCTYDSTTRTGLTLGGLSTREEMCLTFAYYYPRMKLEYCESEPAFDAFGIDPQNLFHDLSMLDWTNKTTVDWALSTINKGKIRQECGGEKFQHQATQFYHPTEPAHPYVPPPANCS